MKLTMRRPRDRGVENLRQVMPVLWSEQQKLLDME